MNLLAFVEDNKPELITDSKYNKSKESDIS